jgi:hypothetical protein
MKQKVREAIENNMEIDLGEIAEQIKEGTTSGILDNEDGYRLVWNINIERFEY